MIIKVMSSKLTEATANMLMEYSKCSLRAKYSIGVNMVLSGSQISYRR